jgi:hypothetical protein
MARKEDLIDWVIEALRARGGRATIVQVCKTVWEKHETELRKSGDLFYTWQHDVTWAATSLRNRKIMRPAVLSPQGFWELAK